jgi:prepilin-type processing-associated H-X9-DG protein
VRQVHGKAGSRSDQVAPYSCHPDANDTLFGTGKNVLFGDGSVQWQTGAHLLRYRPAFQDMALAGEAYSIINHARDYLLILGPDGTVTRNKQTDPSYNASEVHYNRLYR